MSLNQADIFYLFIIILSSLYFFFFFFFLGHSVFLNGTSVQLVKRNEPPSTNATPILVERSVYIQPEKSFPKLVPVKFGDLQPKTSIFNWENGIFA